MVDPSVYKDKKIKTTFTLLAKGKTKEEIAAHFGHGWSGIDQYFRRKGFRWDGQTFVEKESETASASALEEATLLNTKAGHIVRQLDQKNANLRQIAMKNGFSTVDELGSYMKGQGYVWSSTLENYEYDEGSVARLPSTKQAGEPLQSMQSESLGDYGQLLAYLHSNQDKLRTLLETESDGTLPRYKFRGAKANKTLSFPTTLVTLLNDFSKEYNVTQRAILEVALAEFFRKYGFEDQLNSVLQA
jgi:hypothetical protein